MLTDISIFKINEFTNTICTLKCLRPNEIDARGLLNSLIIVKSYDLV